MNIDTLFLISGKGVDSYQMATFVVIPVFNIIISIIGGVVYLVKKHHTQILRKSTKGSESAHCYEHQDFNSGTSNASESGYDEIDLTDIDMSSSLYDQLGTDRVEYETLQ